MLRFIEGKVHLLGILAKSSVTEIGHNAYNLRGRFGLRASALTDSYAQRIPCSEVALNERFTDDCRLRTCVAWLRDITIIEVSAGNDFYAHGFEELRSDRIQIDIAIRCDSLICKDGHRIVPASSS